MDNRNLFESYDTPRVEIIEIESEQMLASSVTGENGEWGDGLM